MFSLNFCNTDDPDKNHFSSRCNEFGIFNLRERMDRSEFCLLPADSFYFQSDLALSLSVACIPVIMSDSFVLPFSDLIEWSTAALLYYGRPYPEVLRLIHKINARKKAELRSMGKFAVNHIF